MKFPSFATRSNIFFGVQVTLIGIVLSGVSTFAYNPDFFQHTMDATVIAQHENDPTYKYAFEGYGDTCTLETWSYPAKYEGIQDWKDHEPEKAKPVFIEARPNDEGCKKNFNPKNPSVALSGLDYGPNYGTRFKDNYGEPQA